MALRFTSSFMHRQRLSSIEVNEGTSPAASIALALDLFLLAPASVRAQVAQLQDLPPNLRRRVYSEIHDALARGSQIVREIERVR